MSLINPDITLGTMGRGTDGFTFSVLGNLTANGADYTRREQGNNPLFIADFNNQPLVSGVEYKFEVYHPVYAPDRPLLRYTFDEFGRPVPSSPAEDVANTPGAIAGGNGNAIPDTSTLDEVTGRSPNAGSILSTDFFTAWLPQLGGKFLLRPIKTASIWQMLINALTEPIVDALKEALLYELEDLFHLITKRDITRTAEDGSTTTLTDGGIRITEANELTSFIGRIQSGAMQLINKAGYRLTLLDENLSTDARRFDLPAADTVVKSLGLKGLDNADEFGTVLVAVPNIDRLQLDVKGVTLRSLASTLLRFLDYDELRKHLSDIPGEAREPHQILCYDPVLLTQDFIITPDKISVPIPHLLNISGGLIIPTLIGPEHENATDYMTISFPDSSHFQITPKPGYSANFSGLLNIRSVQP